MDNVSERAYPYADCRVTVERVERPSGPRRLWRWLTEVPSRFSIGSLYNVVRIIKTGALTEVFERYENPAAPFSYIPTPKGRQWFTVRPEVMAAVLTHPRSKYGGVFQDIENYTLFTSIINLIWPEEMEEVPVEELKNWIALCADHTHYRGIRAPFIQALAPSVVTKESVRSVAEVFFESINGEYIGVDLGYRYALRILSNLVLGTEFTSEEVQGLVRALPVVAESLEKTVLQMPLEDSVREHFNVFRECIESIINQNGTFVQRLKDRGFCQNAIRAQLFVLFFAGTETTASTVNYLLKTLTIQPEIHTRLSQGEEGLAHNVVCEALRMHPPAYVMGRTVAPDADALFKFRRRGRVVYTERVPARHTIVCSSLGAGRCVPMAEVFSTDREFRPDIRALRHKPFGDGGVHQCPGKRLAMLDIQAFLEQVGQHFTIEHLGRDGSSVGSKGVFMLHSHRERFRLIELVDHQHDLGGGGEAS